ncbi:MAG: YegP family protein [Thermodesulfobacteriota bacterium]
MNPYVVILGFILLELIVAFGILILLYLAISGAIEEKKKPIKMTESESAVIKTSQPAGKRPKFEIFKDKKGEYRFRLKAVNGEIIAVSEGYTQKHSCANGIESIKKNAPIAEIEDLTS